MRRRITVNLTDQQYNRLDAIATEVGVTVTQLIHNLAITLIINKTAR